MTAGTLRTTLAVSSATAPTQRTRRGTWTTGLVRMLPREPLPSVPSCCEGTSSPSPHWPAERPRSWGAAPGQNRPRGTVPCTLWSVSVGGGASLGRNTSFQFGGTVCQVSSLGGRRVRWAGAQSGGGRPFLGRGGPAGPGPGGLGGGSGGCPWRSVPGRLRGWACAGHASVRVPGLSPSVDVCVPLNFRVGPLAGKGDGAACGPGCSALGGPVVPSSSPPGRCVACKVPRAERPVPAQLWSAPWRKRLGPRPLRGGRASRPRHHCCLPTASPSRETPALQRLPRSATTGLQAPVAVGARPPQEGVRVSGAALVRGRDWHSVCQGELAAGRVGAALFQRWE